MSLNLNGFGYDIANGCNAKEKRRFLQYITGLYITIVPGFYRVTPDCLRNAISLLRHSGMIMTLANF